MTGKRIKRNTRYQSRKARIGENGRTRHHGFRHRPMQQARNRFMVKRSNNKLFLLNISRYYFPVTTPMSKLTILCLSNERT